MEYGTHAAEFLAKISARISSGGEETANKMIAAADPLLEWIGHLHTYEKTGFCDHFLDGIRSLILEAVCGASVGLYRSCILSMRGEIDLVMSWLYFKDHPMEWDRVLRENEGYMLKSDVIDYLRDYYPRFKSRYALLENSRTRTSADPYRPLSAHVHSIGSETIPSLKGLADMIGDSNLADQCVVIQSEVSEYISDVLMSAYAIKWASLPPPLVEQVKSRLSGEKYSELLKA